PGEFGFLCEVVPRLHSRPVRLVALVTLRRNSAVPGFPPGVLRKTLSLLPIPSPRVLFQSQKQAPMSVLRPFSETVQWQPILLVFPLSRFLFPLAFFQFALSNDSGNCI